MRRNNFIKYLGLINSINMNRIKVVYTALEELQDKVVFVGGAVVSLYADREVLELRPTDDVDVLVEVLNYKERTELENLLRSKGFTNDIESGIVCRFKFKGIIVDVLPTNDSSIGFQNAWYERGFENAITYRIDDRHSIRILSAPYFLATKFEAFNGRGGGDGRTSQDFEDIVFILEQRSTIWNDLATTDDEVRMYIVMEFLRLKSNPNLREWIDSHVERNVPRATQRIMDEMEKFLVKVF